MKAHTSGPFRTEKRFTPNQFVTETYIVSADDSVLARLGPCNTEGNGALFAAAPDLLAALQACLPFVDKVRAMSGGDGDLAAANARLAIAKVRGEA